MPDEHALNLLVAAGALLGGRLLWISALAGAILVLSGVAVLFGA